MKHALLGRIVLNPLEPEIEEYYRAYRFCKTFNCSLAEYENRPFEETVWMLKIDDVYQMAVKEYNDRAVNG